MKRLVTIATPEILPHCGELLDNQREYAGRNGYEYRPVASPHWAHLHPSFSKVWEIQSALAEGCEFVIWSDADVAFMDFSVDLAHLLEPDYFLAAYHQQNWKSWKYLCAGLSIWRNTQAAAAFVNEWARRCLSGFMVDQPWEQWFADELIRETNYAGIRPCSAHEIGCFSREIWHDGTLWEPGMPTVHLAGPATWERRREVFLKHYLPIVKGG